MSNQNKTQKDTKSLIALFIQFFKFGLIGALNTVIDFAVLNALFWVSGVYSGSLVILFNVVSFSAAVINSYVFNKYWTFQNNKKDVPAQFGKFLFISLIGLIINTAIVFGLSTYVDPLFGLSEELWANSAKIAATFVALAWNFVGYKLWAFADKK